MSKHQGKKKKKGGPLKVSPTCCFKGMLKQSISDTNSDSRPGKARVRKVHSRRQTDPSWAPEHSLWRCQQQLQFRTLLSLIPHLTVCETRKKLPQKARFRPKNFQGNGKKNKNALGTLQEMKKYRQTVGDLESGQSNERNFT